MTRTLGVEQLQEWIITYGVTVNVLGNRVDHNVGTVIQRVLDIGAHESVVDNHQNTVAVSNLRNGTDINKAQSGVGGSFNPDELSLIRADQFLNILLDGGRESHVDTVGLSNLGEVAVGSTIHVGNRDDVGPSSQGLQNDGSGSGAGREGQGILSMLQSSNSFLEVVPAFCMLITCMPMAQYDWELGLTG